MARTKILNREWNVASVPQIAQYVGVAHAKVLAWIDSGELVAHNVATTTSTRPIYRVDRMDFDRFWKSRAVTGETANA